MLELAWASLRSRALSVGLTVLVITLSVVLLLGVERVRTQAHEGFASTVSGTDLIVGARSGPVNLLLYSVFHIGDPTNNVSWQSYQELSALPQVKWSVPLSLGDSWRDYRVVGTTGGYFEHYRYGSGHELAFAQGRPFDDLYDAVIGAEVARAQKVGLGDEIVLAHGTGAVTLAGNPDFENKASRSALRASCSAPARRWIRRCWSRCRPSRRSMSTGHRACSYAARASAPSRRATWT